jgi:hypothetical protein
MTARLPSVTPGHPLDRRVMPGHPLDVSEAGTIQGTRSEEPGTRAWNRRAVRAAGSLGKPTAVRPVNLALTIVRYRVRVAMVPGIRGLRARGNKTKAGIRTIQWTIRGRVDHPTVNVRLTCRCTAICARDRRGRRPIMPTLERTAVGHSEGGDGGSVRSGSPEDSHGGSVPSGLARTATAGSVRSGLPQGRPRRRRSVRACPRAITAGGVAPWGAGGATRGSIHQACGEAS